MNSIVRLPAFKILYAKINLDHITNSLKNRNNKIYKQLNKSKE